MTRWTTLAGVSLWLGATLLLSLVPWCRVPPLAERLRPYLPGTARSGRVRPISGESIRDVVGPLAAAVGERVARLSGVHEDLAARLARVGSPIDATQFRLRQAAWAAASLVGAALLAVAAGAPPALATALVLGGPTLAFLVLEQRATSASQRWQERVVLELPVVIEQLGMLLSSGYSVGAALHRLGRRGKGACAGDLAEVSRRMRQGIGDADALREWAARAGVPAVDRLVGVLALNWEASDLGDLIAAEARAVRRQVHRAELEWIERRSQQVWIPVTVATLLPGVIFMAVPFIDAMATLSGGS